MRNHFMVKAGRRTHSKRPLIIAVTVLAILMGAGLYVFYGPGGAEAQNAAVIGLNFRQGSDSTRPFIIDVVIQNRGDSEARIRVEVTISPADASGTGRIGPTEGTLLNPDEARGISVAFNPDPLKDYSIRASASAEPPGVESDPSDNEQTLAFPVYHYHAVLTVEIFHADNTTQTVQIPSRIGLANGLWANHTLDNPWGFPGFRAALYTEPPSSDPGSTVYDGSVHIQPTRIGKEFTVGDFFEIWGAGLTDSCIRIPDVIDTCTPGGPSGVLVMEITPAGSSSPRQIQEDYRGQVLEDGVDVWIAFIES